jgi:tetrahydromethanopterin S-methyltransferase subunit G
VHAADFISTANTFADKFAQPVERDITEIFTKITDDWESLIASQTGAKTDRLKLKTGHKRNVDVWCTGRGKTLNREARAAYASAVERFGVGTDSEAKKRAKQLIAPFDDFCTNQTRDETALEQSMACQRAVVSETQAAMQTLVAGNWEPSGGNPTDSCDSVRSSAEQVLKSTIDYVQQTYRTFGETFMEKLRDAAKDLTAVMTRAEAAKKDVSWSNTNSKQRKLFGKEVSRALGIVRGVASTVRGHTRAKADEAISALARLADEKLDQIFPTLGIGRKSSKSSK